MAKYRLKNGDGYSLYIQGEVYDDNNDDLKDLIYDYPEDWELVEEPTFDEIDLEDFNEKKSFLDDYYFKVISNAFKIPPQYFNEKPSNPKSITELLKRIKKAETKGDDEAIPELVIFADGSGGIKRNRFEDGDKYFVEWFNKKEMNEVLNKLDVEYSNTNNEWQL